MRAISFLSLDAGISTSAWSASAALRIRVRKSDTGSVSIRYSRSPARLDHARDVSLVRGIAQAQPAQAELPVIGARSSAPPAPVVPPGLVLRLPLLLDFLRSL